MYPINETADDSIPNNTEGTITATFIFHFFFSKLRMTHQNSANCA